jgi:hypothetical protein
MTLCKNCDYWAICLANPEDHIIDGEVREILGCNQESYIPGRLLADAPDYWRLHTNGTP